jgi:hypothetical protein
MFFEAHNMLYVYAIYSMAHITLRVIYNIMHDLMPTLYIICIHIHRKAGSQKLAPGRVPCDSTGRSLDTILQDNQATDMCQMCDV